MARGSGGSPSQPGARRGTASALNWVGEQLAVVGPDPHGAIASLAALMPPESGVVTVVGQLAGPDDWAFLTEALPIAVPPGSAARLAVSGAGMDAAGSGPPAAALARQLQADVYAPSGQLLLIPGGGMFAIDGWRWFAPDGRVRRGGRRHPRPHWEAEVDTLVRHAAPGVRAYAVPAGIWLFTDAPHLPEPGLDDLVLAVPMDRDRVTVVLGRPGTPPPDAEAVFSLVEALDPSMLIASYGDAAGAALQLAGTVARHWDTPVEVATGLPTLDGADRLVSVSLDADGQGWWTPPVSRLRCTADGPPVPVGPVDFLADLRPAGPGSYRLNERWVVEATQFGLWVRPPFAGQHLGDVRRRPGQSRRLMILVGLPGLPLPDDVLPVLHMLLNRLTAEARARVDFEPAELDHLLTPDSTDRPDVVLAAQRSTPPRWWHRDSRFFAVLLTVDGPTGTVRTDAGDVEPGQLGEILAAYRDPDPRPVLLIGSAPVAPDVEQLLADQLQAVTIGRRADGWWASLPRRVDRQPRPAIRLTTAFPFSDDDLATVLTPPRPAPPRAPSGPPGAAPLQAPFGPAGAAPLRAPSGPSDAAPLLALAPVPEGFPAGDGSRTVVAARGPDQRQPFRLDGRPVTAWEFAIAVADQRPGWAGRPEPVRLEVGEIAEPMLRLLANYLRAPVSARSRLVADVPSATAASGWFTVTPRDGGVDPSSVDPHQRSFPQR
ncbi:hypothetical protein [Actinoplanes derwentensis]|nr:hypothetical protein [Actinoplanes derwentensis]